MRRHRKLVVNAAVAAAFATAGVAFAVDSATYHVPTNPALADAATMPLARVDARVRESGRLELKYRLPAELDGENGLAIDVRGRLPASGGTATLVGSTQTPGCEPASPDDESCTVHSTAQCTTSVGANLVCIVSYENLAIDHARARAYLEAQGLSAERIEKLQKVGVELQHQAIGIVTVPDSQIRRD